MTALEPRPGGWLDDWGDLEPDRTHPVDHDSPLGNGRAPGGLPITWVDERWTQPPAEPPVLVDGLLRAGEFLGIASLRGIGKSMLAMNLAILLARGHGQLAGTLPIKTAARVLYAQGELDPWEAHQRWYRMSGRDQPPDGIAETYEPWRIRVVTRRTSGTLRDDAGSSTTSDEYHEAVLDHRLEEAIVAHRIGVLIIDPWAVFYSGKESDNDHVEAALGKLRELCLRHHTAIVVVHHVGKNTIVREPEDLWRGAGRLADWCSTRMTVLPHYTEAEAARLKYTRQEGRRFVDVKLLRRSGYTPDFHMAINHQTGWWEAWTPDAAAEQVAKPGRPRIEMTAEDVADRCADDGGWDSMRAVCRSLGVSHTTADKLLDLAVRAGLLLELPGQGRSRRYTLATPSANGRDDV